MLFISLWILSGLLGSYIGWRDIMIERRLPMCPTPRAIMFGLIAACFGFATLATTATISIIGWLTYIESHDCWWTRPVCGPKK